MPNITQEQIESLLSELQTGLSDLAKSEAAKAVKEETLVKAHPGEETKDEGTPDVSATSAKDTPKEEPKAESKPEPDHSAVKGPEAAPEAHKEPDGDEGMSASADPAAEDDGPVDPVKLHEEYSKLSPEDLKAHYIACKAALFEMVGSGDGDEGEAGPDAAPAAPAPAMPEGPAPDAPPTMKGEKDMSDGANGGEHMEVKKSEQDTEVEALKKELAARDEALSKLAKAMETVMTTPIRKSVVSLSELPKVENTKSVTNMTREEVKGKLRDKIREGKLSKSDADLVIKFDLNQIKVQDVAHILESKTS